MEPKEFQAWIYPQGMVWDVYCLNLHQALIQEIFSKRRARDPNVYDSFDEMAHAFKLWLGMEAGFPSKPTKSFQLEKVTAAGKNFGSFDLQFLTRRSMGMREVFRQRSLDPTVFYTLPDDPHPPELIECKRRAGMDPTVAHRALDDAWDVVKLLQKAFKK